MSKQINNFLNIKLNENFDNPFILEDSEKLKFLIKETINIPIRKKERIMYICKNLVVNYNKVMYEFYYNKQQ